MKQKRFLLVLSLILCLISCKDEIKKDIAYYEIYDYDNIFANENKGINYIDSLLKIYPQSDYFHGLRIMMLGNEGLVDSAFNYQQLITSREHILGTFIRMGYDWAVMIYYFKNGGYLPNDLFLESIKYDTKKVNIWARIGAYLVNFYYQKNIYPKEYQNYSNAEKYLLEAFDINNENSYLLERLINFNIEMQNYPKAYTYFKEINSKY